MARVNFVLYRQSLVLLCFPNLLCCARKFGKGLFLCGYDRISAMQISRFTKIVIFVTSLGFTFLSCIALFIFYFYLALLLLLLYSLECAGGFRSCGSDHGLCPLDSHKPLKRLDRNFYMDALLLLFGSSGFVLCCDRGGLLSHDFQQT